MLSQGGLRWAGGLDGYPGWCFGGSGSWGNVPHPQNFPPTRVKAVSGERSFVGNFPGREAGNASCWEERMAPGGNWIGMEGTRGTRWTPPSRAYWALFCRLGWGRKRVPVGRPTRRPPAQLVPLHHLLLSPGGLRPPGSGHKGFAELGWAAAPSAPPWPRTANQRRAHSCSAR